MLVSTQMTRLVTNLNTLNDYDAIKFIISRLSPIDALSLSMISTEFKVYISKYIILREAARKGVANMFTSLDITKVPKCADIRCISTYFMRPVVDQSAYFSPIFVFETLCLEAMINGHDKILRAILDNSHHIDPIILHRILLRLRKYHWCIDVIDEFMNKQLIVPTKQLLNM